MEKKIKIAAVGDNCIDLYVNTGEFYPGGNAVNVAVYVKRMNGDSSYTGVVGNDDYGKFMIASLNKKGSGYFTYQNIRGQDCSYTCRN